MDFELSKEQQDIQKAAREFAVGEFREIARDCDLNEEFPRSLLEKAGDLGFIGVFINEEYGGAGLGFLEHALILEEFWKVDPGIGQGLCSGSFGAKEFFYLEQKNRKTSICLP